VTTPLERPPVPEGGTAHRSGPRAGRAAALGDEMPTASLDDARAVASPPSPRPTRSLPPDIITLELELGAPLPGPETVGHEDGASDLPHVTARRRLGRFSVLGVVGRGAMGTVLEAYDDTLARTVALKLLHGRVDELRRDRLLREAQALAQLSHPNVVQVYEVGLVEDQMFIAMELVEGDTLRKWQRQRRPWREVVVAYLQAGRGLAAAHARGLVHRDFKPENCIIGENGRVRVLDFGLARGSKSAEEPTRPIVHPAENSALQLRMTQSGKVLGTLSFLPLQQLMGRPADAKSDQFSFCVSLYEALYGVLPFSDRSLDALISAQRAQELQPVPRGHRVPRRLRRVLLRGLATLPEERWPSMEALLAALERLQAPHRWPVAATLVVGFGAGAVVFAETRAEEPCHDGRAALEGTWGPADHAAVEAAYLGSGHEEAPRLLERVQAELDGYTAEWVRMHEESCRATFVRHEQPEAVLEQGMRCLQRHHGRLRATIDALADVSTAADALERTALPFKLPTLSSCAEPDAAEPSLALPSEPKERERVLALRHEVDRANTLAEAGAMGPALEVATAAVDDARGMGHEAVLAEALETLGRLQTMGGAAAAAEQTLQEAIGVAAGAKDDTMAARAWSTLIYAVMAQDELDRGLSLRFAAFAAVDRAEDPVARAWLLNNLGTLHGQRGEHDVARQHFEQALAVKQQVVGPDHLDTGIAWINLGLALKEERRLDEAAEAFEYGRSIVTSTVGESHLIMAFVETGLGHVRQLQQDLPRALEHQRRALEIRERALGPNHLLVAKSLEHLGKTELRQGELDGAVEHLRRALDFYERAGGSGNAKVGVSCVWLAEAELGRGRRNEARALAERALGLLGPAAGRPEERARASFVMARALEREPTEVARARMYAEQALGGFTGSERLEVEAWLRKHPLPEAQ
jgi:tetratricopeptide (TPR) repeat protein/predicted Ser/Thr protein kinase